MNNTLKLGLIGFGISLILNLLGIFVFKTSAAELFSDDWWSAWFPSHLVWLVFLIIGIGRQLSGKNTANRSEAS